MYCKQCGQAFANDKAVVCVKCGISKGQGDNYCQECGMEVKNKSADVCLNCGVKLKGGMNNFTNHIKNVSGTSSGSNNKLVAILLSLFLGTLGIHRFYLGYKQIGFIQLGIFVVGLLITPIILISSIWALVDLIQIAMGKLNNADGTELI